MASKGHTGGAQTATHRPVATRPAGQELRAAARSSSGVLRRFSLLALPHAAAVAFCSSHSLCSSTARSVARV